jgi:cell wall assembly regulator SMI1
MLDLWNRLAEALRKLNPVLAKGLRPTSDEASVAACEAALGVRFPADFRESLLLPGGEVWAQVLAPGRPAGVQVINRIEWLHPQAIQAEWKRWRDDIGTWNFEAEAHGPVRQMWWNPKWIPISIVGGSTYHHCLDLDPAEGGQPGQIIELGMKFERRIVVARSFRELLQMLVEDVEAGAFELYEDVPVLLLTDDASEGRTLGGFKSPWYSGW